MSFNNFSAPGSYPVSGNVDMSLIADQARKPSRIMPLLQTEVATLLIHRFFKFKAPLHKGDPQAGLWERLYQDQSGHSSQLMINDL